MGVVFGTVHCLGARRGRATKTVQSGAARSFVLAAPEVEVRAATHALEGVQRKALAGHRTTREGLNSQQHLTAARIKLIQSQRDRTVASHTPFPAIRRFNHRRVDFATVSGRPDLRALAGQ